MSITLTTDAIITEQDARELLSITGDTARLLINSASSMFLGHTGRSRITSGSVTEYLLGRGTHLAWLSTPPVTAVTSIELYVSGSLNTTFAATDYQLDTSTGRLATYSKALSVTNGEKGLKAVYTGGWTAGSLPGSVVGGAVELIRFLHAKLDKARAGVVSESIEGHSVQYEAGGLPRAVREAWQPYKVYGI